MAAFPWRRFGGWGDPREGFILTMCRKWHATCGAGSDELHSEKAFFWFEQLTPVWPGLRHAVRPWSSGESHLAGRMSQRHLATGDASQSVHQSCGKLRLCGLDRPDTEAGGALLEMPFVAARAALDENGGQDVCAASWMPHDMRSFHGMLTDAMRPPWGDRTNHGGGWLGGWGDPRGGFVPTTCRKWHATCGNASGLIPFSRRGRFSS